MLELKNWYRDRLPTRIAALEEAREGVTKRTSDAIDAVRRIGHSLRGSGATYGFPEITEAARALEEAEEGAILERLEALVQTLRTVHAAGRTLRTSILIVEDDEDQARFIAEAIASPDRDLFEARTAAEAQAILEEKEVSLILLDLILPDTDGRNFLLKLRERLATATVPVIVLTVKRAVQAKAECLALGADDFIEKPVARETLREAVAARLRPGSEAAREIRRDPVTGLPNRAAFSEIFQRTRYGLSSSREPLSAALLQIDGFPKVVEERGSAAADQALCRAASILSRSLRGTDFLARWSGTEFAALFLRTGPSEAVRALEKALRALRDEPFPAGDGGRIRLTFSAGVAPVFDGMSLDDLLSEADRFLFLARDAGGDRIVSSADKLLPPRRKILLAEDDELIRLVVKRLLEREGYDVLAFPDGSGALRGALENTVAMVVTDVRMPGMDGFELLGRLRANPEYAALPIVMLTSMGSEEDVVRGFEGGADDYIVKPFSSAELVARIRRLLKAVPAGV
ncbi:MAG TPA: response regulator [Planctomycetota bacterium]|nr:response regulator [Planctomycetota bacterium]